MENNETTIPTRRHVDQPNKDTALPCDNAAQTKTEKLDCLTKAHQEHPGDPRVRAAIYEEVKEVVDQDPYLEYHAENTQAYRVIDRAQQVLIVPKERARPETYPASRPVPIRRAYRYLLYAALGLILSGLGAVIFAPAAMRYAFQALGPGSQPADRVRARVISGLALVLFAAGLAFVYLLWIHIRG